MVFGNDSVSFRGDIYDVIAIRHSGPGALDLKAVWVAVPDDECAILGGYLVAWFNEKTKQQTILGVLE